MLDQIVQALPTDVSVDLGGPDIRVTQHLLHRSQIRAALQKMRCERMA